MKRLESKKFKLPIVFFITDRKEIKDLPIGIPFIYGDEDYEEYIVRLLEYEILFERTLATKLPFDFAKILKENGYNDLTEFWHNRTVYMDYKTEEDVDEDLIRMTKSDMNFRNPSFKKFIRDSAVYIDIKKIKELNVFAVWYNTIEDALETNIHNFATFNPYIYNKKLDMVCGDVEFNNPRKNLIILDISGSIPKASSSTILLMSKNMAETFFADIMITGSKTTLYDYHELYKLNIDTIYEENGMDNDQAYFKKIVSSNKKHYKTVIVFGDNHSPCDKWRNEYNKGTKTISREDGKKICKWEVDKVISFHTTSNTITAGYADWFEPKEVENIKDWIQYLK